MDAAGRPVASSLGPLPDPRAWSLAARFLVGSHPSRPPRVSNRQWEGRRGRNARGVGMHLWLPPRTADIQSLAVESVAASRIAFRTSVGRGTYIRALVRDWAEAVGHAAHLSVLIRTRVGPCAIADSWTAEEVAQADDVPLWSWRRLWPHATAELNGQDTSRVLQGQWSDALSLALPSAGPVALTGPGGTLVAVAEDRRLRRVFPVPWT